METLSVSLAILTVILGRVIDHIRSRNTVQERNSTVIRTAAFYGVLFMVLWYLYRRFFRKNNVENRCCSTKRCYQMRCRDTKKPLEHPHGGDLLPRERRAICQKRQSGKSNDASGDISALGQDFSAISIRDSSSDNDDRELYSSDLRALKKFHGENMEAGLENEECCEDQQKKVERKQKRRRRKMRRSRCSRKSKKSQKRSRSRSRSRKKTRSRSPTPKPRTVCELDDHSNVSLENLRKLLDETCNCEEAPSTSSQLDTSSIRLNEAQVRSRHTQQISPSNTGLLKMTSITTLFRPAGLNTESDVKTSNTLDTFCTDPTLENDNNLLKDLLSENCGGDQIKSASAGGVKPGEKERKKRGRKRKNPVLSTLAWLIDDSEPTKRTRSGTVYGLRF